MNTALTLLIIAVAVVLLTAFVGVGISMFHDTQDRDPYHRTEPPLGSQPMNGWSFAAAGLAGISLVRMGIRAALGNPCVHPTVHGPTAVGTWICNKCGAELAGRR